MASRTCGLAGVGPDDKCPTATILLELKKKLDEMQTCRTKNPIAARLHITSEVCECAKKKHDPNAGKIKMTFPKQSLSGVQIEPVDVYVNPPIKWTPPVQTIQKDPHKYMSCFGGHLPPDVDCDCPDCQFSIHLAQQEEEKPHECCYIVCGHDKPGFRDWRPRHVCHYPGVCRAACFEHPFGSDFFDMEPLLHQECL